MRSKRIIIFMSLLLALVTAVGALYFYAPQTLVLYRGASWEKEGLFSGITNLDESIETGGNVIVPTKVGDYTARLSIFGIPYKSIKVRVLEEKTVVAGGETIGIRLFSDGLIVVGVGRVSEEGTSPGEEAGIEPGDVITKVNGEKIGTPEEFAAVIAASEGEVELEIKHGAQTRVITLEAQKSKYDGEKRLGLWVRDSTAGVGTLTYIDPETHSYGALGHSVSDADTGVRFEVKSGSIEECGVTEIVKSEKGSPGELKGVFYGGQEVMGTIDKNTACGIFGTVLSDCGGERLKIALKSEVKAGEAVIRTSLGEGVRDYSVNIRRVSPNAKNPSKGMIIEVTDEALLAKTGGIVQGMSGSPILQNGKIVGAVTHVLVNDPSMGYAIFAESMIDAASE